MGLPLPLIRAIYKYQSENILKQNTALQSLVILEFLVQALSSNLVQRSFNS